MYHFNRKHVDNPELILSTIALHAVFVLFSRYMKKAIDNSTKGMLNVVVTEILASFMFVACIFEKGLWYANVNEDYFHVATAAQLGFIHFNTIESFINLTCPLTLIVPGEYYLKVKFSKLSNDDPYISSSTLYPIYPASQIRWVSFGSMGKSQNLTFWLILSS